MSGLLLLRRPLQARCLSSRLLLPLQQLQQVRRYALIGKPQAKSEPTWALPSTPARTRFAPSPTGYLHLGSLRTALFNYLLARATGGQFIIRLEDTDQARFVEDSEQRLYDDLRWAGLHWDEGPDKGGEFGPYKQSLRLDLYRQHAHQLLESGHAFRCFCSREDLEFNVAQATASGGAAHYPGTCKGINSSEADRRAANGEPHTIRFIASEERVTVPDLVYNAYKKADREDDFIIMKSDGFPTYHFANVVDDHYMKITHVIRGAEWLISTPKHVELYNAFGWQPPNFAHVGLLVDHQRQKLSKRDIENIGVSVYREHKILPEALLNYAVLLGWDPHLKNNPNLDKRGSMTLEQMKDNFTLKFTRGDIVVNLAKLKHFHAKLTRDLISGAVQDPAALRQYIVGPIMSKLEEVEKKPNLLDRLSWDETSKFLESIGERTSRAPEVTEDYVLKVLKAWKGPVDDHFQWVYDNIFAFYPVAKRALRQSYYGFQENMQRLLIKKGEKNLVNTDIHKVLMWFRHNLSEVSEDDWNEETLGPVAKMLADSIEYYDTKKEELMVKSPGWKFLRWALLNGRSGLSIVPIMVLLGREETLYRMRTARKIVRDEQERQGKLKEKEDAEALTRKVRFRYMGEAFGEEAKQDTTSRDLLERTIEPRNVKIRVPKMGENNQRVSPLQSLTPMPTEEMEMQDPPALHVDKGPFASRPPETIPHQLTKRRPADVDRSPQFLDFQSWKTGLRHLELDGKRAEDKMEYAPAPWELEVLPESTGDRRIPEAPEPGGGDEEAPHWADPAFLERRSKHIEAPPARVPNKPPPPAGKKGPFMPGQPMEDYHAHVQHLRELNAAEKLRRDAEEQQKPPRPESQPGRLDALKSSVTGPMYAGKALGGTPEEIAARDRKGHFLAGRDLHDLLRGGRAKLPFEVAAPDVMSAMARNARAAELERQAVKAVVKEDDISMREAEQRVASHWAKRSR